MHFRIFKYTTHSNAYITFLTTLLYSVHGYGLIDKTKTKQKQTNKAKQETKQNKTKVRQGNFFYDARPKAKVGLLFTTCF